MTRQGVILYGPPTSGKDTATTALIRQDDRYALLPKLKYGTGRSTGYRLVSPAELDDLRSTGRLVVETHRYGNVYAIDRRDITALVEVGRVPIVHMGNVADLERLRTGAPMEWTSVLLWIPRAVCAERSPHRGDVDTPRRLAAWDETYRDVQAAADRPVFNLVIRTDRAGPDEVARQITEAVAADTRQPAAIPNLG
ncbi:guanylate kinase [Actinomadura sp. WMMA1423]|uniref:guanylate kinase n=1 Tax=Actinomadura sp. WMMA1423 TaxID=2591108 RepID=UPI001146DE7D|nr:guanylate kinase [Actinomadura sp. WMMA1423]